ncbi:MAG: zinc-ribbon domain-containing protein [Candidatus Hodarchaeales archaeon]
MPFCKNCGAQVPEGARFCEECGRPQVSGPAQPAAPAHPPAAYPPTAPAHPPGAYPPTAPAHPPGVYSRKDGALAAILSLIIPGVGQMYCGRMGRGIAIFFLTGCLIWFIIGIIPWIWGIFDANDSAKKYNAYLDAYGRPPIW